MKDSRKVRTRHAILVAMVTCLKTENFDQITTSKLAQTAGISRAGFYNHYRDKYDLIEFYQQDLFNRLEQVFERNQDDIHQTFLEILTFLKEEELLTALLGPNGTREIQSYTINKIRLFIDTQLFDQLGSGTGASMEKEYSSVYFAYAFFGIVQHWLEKGKKERPEQLTDFIMQLLPDAVLHNQKR